MGKPFIRDISPDLHFIEWTGESLRQERQRLGLTRGQIAKALGVAGPTITKIEEGHSVYTPAVQLYGIILERYYANQCGYIPAFRKIGENKFMDTGGEVAADGEAAQTN